MIIFWVTTNEIRRTAQSNAVTGGSQWQRLDVLFKMVMVQSCTFTSWVILIVLRLCSHYLRRSVSLPHCQLVESFPVPARQLSDTFSRSRPVSGLRFRVSACPFWKFLPVFLLRLKLLPHSETQLDVGHRLSEFLPERSLSSPPQTWSHDYHVCIWGQIHFLQLSL